MGQESVGLAHRIPAESMRFIAKLVTYRQLEKPVQKIAPDQVNAEGVAREFLMDAQSRQPLNGCMFGDAFEIYETRLVLVATLRLMSDGTIDRVTPEAQ